MRILKSIGHPYLHLRSMLSVSLTMENLMYKQTINVEELCFLLIGILNLRIKSYNALLFVEEIHAKFIAFLFVSFSCRKMFQYSFN